MAPRSGQLDQISEAIGEVRGKIDGIERYVHEWRHGVNNVSQKVDGLGVKIAGDLAGLRAEIRADLDTLGARVAKLEASDIRADTQKNTVSAILQSPIIGGVVGSIITWAAILIAWWKGHGR